MHEMVDGAARLLKENPVLRPLVLLRRRLISRRSSRKREIIDRMISLHGQSASDSIYSLLGSGEPCFVGRFGSCELGIVAEFARRRGKMDIDSNALVWTMAEKGGFYPVTLDSVRRFAELNVDLMENIDILGSWCPEEADFRKRLKAASKVPLKDLEPYMNDSPWTRALSGKKVLVINPLVATIRTQYLKRKTLFKSADMLPEFELLLYKPVYEFDRSERAYDSWFDALEKMERDIASIRFDVAIIGCGPFGMPLADRVKKLGRQAIVLGGATQILFGIKGGRWDRDPFFQGLYNDHWVYPSREETPIGAMTLEQGCYWKPAGQ